MVRSLCMQAVKATLGGLPVEKRLSRGLWEARPGSPRQRPARSSARRNVLVVVLPSLTVAMRPGLDGGAGRSSLARIPGA